MFSKKLSIPSLKKKMNSFLTDESGKITKKDALWIALGAALLWAASAYWWQAFWDPVAQGHVNGTSNHFNKVPSPGGWHGSVYSTGTCGHVNSPNPHYWHISSTPIAPPKILSGHGNS